MQDWLVNADAMSSRVAGLYLAYQRNYHSIRAEFERLTTQAGQSVAELGHRVGRSESSAAADAAAGWEAMVKTEADQLWVARR